MLPCLVWEIIGTFIVNEINFRENKGNKGTV